MAVSSARRPCCLGYVSSTGVVGEQRELGGSEFMIVSHMIYSTVHYSIDARLMQHSHNRARIGSQMQAA